MDIQWEQPPVTYRGRARASYADLAEALVANTGTWALVLTTAHQGTANALSHRIRISSGAWKIGSFEAVMRTAPKSGESKVWARAV